MEIDCAMLSLFLVSTFSDLQLFKGYFTSQCKVCRHKSSFVRYAGNLSKAKCTAAVQEPLSFEPSSVNSRVGIKEELARGLELPCGAKRLEDAPCGDGANCPFVRYQCKRGHIIKAIKGSPVCKACPLCTYEAEAELCPELRRGSRKRLSLETMQRIASRRGGTCLSTFYKSVRDKFLWRCSEGHEWYASGDNVRRGSWCPVCTRKTQALDISELKEMAKLRGGRCLSTEYKNVHQKLMWECSQGHIFLMSANNIRRKSTSSRPPSWCPVCANKKRSEKRKKCGGKSTSYDEIFVTKKTNANVPL